MTSLDASRTTYGIAAFANRFAAGTANLIGYAIAWNDARTTARALHNLTDRELADVGLTRGDIASVASSDFIR
ncbi:DUF1127 domain-containing protein [Sulfitobacter sp. HNIBRBA2951]|uniref:DUF1127 domain-containing protein n=1 Tax=Sulfitobacter aquimarinus TaxID=3158557 RepID=UPI0032DF4A63